MFGIFKKFIMEDELLILNFIKFLGTIYWGKGNIKVFQIFTYNEINEIKH